MSEQAVEEPATRSGSDNAVERHAIDNLFADPNFATLPTAPGLLTTLHSDDDDSPEVLGTVRWQESTRSTDESSEGSRLSTFSMHLARC